MCVLQTPLRETHNSPIMPLFSTSPAVLILGMRQIVKRLGINQVIQDYFLDENYSYYTNILY